MTQKKIRVFLGDLTYNTIGMSTASFPLNVGYIAAYCKKQFGSKIDITIFKYIDELEAAIYENPPDILGLSNYVWGHRIGSEMFDLVHSQNPNTITVWGGIVQDHRGYVVRNAPGPYNTGNIGYGKSYNFDCNLKCPGGFPPLYPENTTCDESSEETPYKVTAYF